MHYSSVAAVLQSLHQASEADESSPNYIVADPQKERHMNQSNMGQNNIFSKKERDSLYCIGDSSSDSFSDKKNNDLNESKHRRSSKITRRIRDHHRRRIQVRRLSPSPDFRSLHAKRQRNSFKKSRQSRDHHRQRSESSYQQSARRSSPDYTVNARFRGRTRRDSSDSSSEYKDTSKSARLQVRRRDSSDSSFEFNEASRTARFRVRRRRDSSSEFSDSSSIIARKKARRWLNYNNFNECPPESEESFIEEKNYTDEGTFETNFDLDPRKGNYYLKDTKNDSAYNSNQSDAHYKEDEEQIDLKQGNLRPIIIDGANIGHQWGRNRFSAMGYKIVYDHFKKEFGYPDDKIVIVHKHIPSEHLQVEDWAIIKDFKQTGILINAPSRIVGDGETLIQSDDDVFCLTIAHTYGGIGKKYFHFLIKSFLNRN